MYALDSAQLSPTGKQTTVLRRDSSQLCSRGQSLPARSPALNRLLFGTALVAVAAMLFATLGYVTRGAASVGMEALPFIVWRGLIGTLALLGVAIVLARRGAGSSRTARPGSSRRLSPSRRRALVVGALLGAALNIAMFEAFNRTAIGVALICFYTFPAIVTLAAIRFYGEQLDRVRIGALALSAAGLALVVLAPLLTGTAFTLDAIGVGLAFFAAGCQAAFVLIAGRGFDPVPAPTIGAFVVFVAAAVALVLALVTGDFAGLAVPFHTQEAWVWILAGSITGAAIPTTAFIAGIGIIGPSRAAIMMTLEPVIGVLIAGALLGERPSFVQLIGGAAVIVAAAILQVAPSRNIVPEPESGPIV